MLKGVLLQAAPPALPLTADCVSPGRGAWGGAAGGHSGRLSVDSERDTAQMRLPFFQLQEQEPWRSLWPQARHSGSV